jgi:hypothetical protein
LKNLEEMKDAKNVFIEDVEENDYYPVWMDVYEKYHLLLK